jgi:hypothetical protein
VWGEEVGKETPSEGKAGCGDLGGVCGVGRVSNL